MKILYIAKFDYPDYANDMVFHGLKSLYGTNCEEYNPAPYMYNDYLHKKSLYGKGFSVYCKLDERNAINNPDKNLIEEKIKSHFYDVVIYGSVFRCLHNIELVCKHYNKKEIALLDGEDFQGIKSDLFNVGTYFKRELTHHDTSINPISFSIPKECIRPFNFYKSKDWAQVIPGKPETYIYDYEQDYYNDMYTSKFAITRKKAGWDCLRHYEIMAASCFPAFEDISNIPERTMQFFPKKLIKDYYIKYGYSDSEQYVAYLKAMHKWVSMYCTTEVSAKYILHKLKGENESNKNS